MGRPKGPTCSVKGCTSPATTPLTTRSHGVLVDFEMDGCATHATDIAARPDRYRIDWDTRKPQGDKPAKVLVYAGD